MTQSVWTVWDLEERLIIISYQVICEKVVRQRLHEIIKFFKAVGAIVVSFEMSFLQANAFGEVDYCLSKLVLFFHRETTVVIEVPFGGIDFYRPGEVLYG